MVAGTVGNVSFCYLIWWVRLVAYLTDRLPSGTDVALFEFVGSLRCLVEDEDAAGLCGGRVNAVGGIRFPLRIASTF